MPTPEELKEERARWVTNPDSLRDEKDPWYKPVVKEKPKPKAEATPGQGDPEDRTSRALALQIRSLYTALGLTQHSSTLAEIYNLSTNKSADPSLLRQLQVAFPGDDGTMGKDLRVLFECLNKASATDTNINKLDPQDLLIGTEKAGDKSMKHELELTELQAFAYLGGLAGSLKTYVVAHEVTEGAADTTSVLDGIRDWKAPMGSAASVNRYFRGLWERLDITAKDLATRGFQLNDSDYDGTNDTDELTRLQGKLAATQQEITDKQETLKGLPEDEADAQAALKQEIDALRREAFDDEQAVLKQEELINQSKEPVLHAAMEYIIRDNKEALSGLFNKYAEEIKDGTLDPAERSATTTEVSFQIKDLKGKLAEAVAADADVKKVNDSHIPNENSKSKIADGPTIIKYLSGNTPGDLYQDSAASELESTYLDYSKRYNKVEALIKSAQGSTGGDEALTKLTTNLGKRLEIDKLSAQYLFGTVIKDKANHIQQKGFGGPSVSFIRHLKKIHSVVKQHLNTPDLARLVGQGIITNLKAIAKGTGSATKAVFLGPEVLNHFNGANKETHDIDVGAYLGEGLNEFATKSGLSTEDATNFKLAVQDKLGRILPREKREVMNPDGTVGEKTVFMLKKTTLTELYHDSSKVLLEKDTLADAEKEIKKLSLNGLFADMSSEEVRNLAKIYGSICDNSKKVGQKSEFLTQSDSSWDNVAGIAYAVETTTKDAFKKVIGLVKDAESGFKTPIAPLNTKGMDVLSKSLTSKLPAGWSESKLYAYVEEFTLAIFMRYVVQGKGVSISSDEDFITNGEGDSQPGIVFSFNKASVIDATRKALEETKIKETANEGIPAKKARATQVLTSIGVLQGDYEGTMAKAKAVLAHITSTMNSTSVSVSSFRDAYETASKELERSAHGLEVQLSSIHMSGYALGGRGLNKYAATTGLVETLAEEYRKTIEDAVATDPELIALKKAMEDGVGQVDLLLHSAISLYRSIKCKATAGPYVNSPLAAHTLNRDLESLPEDTTKLLHALESLIAYLASGCDPDLVPETLGKDFSAPVILALLGKQSIKATVHKYYMRLKSKHEAFFKENKQRLAEAIMSVVMPKPVL